MRVQDLSCHITPLLAELQWLPVRSRIHYKILLITFKILHGLSPKYLSDLISIQQPSSYHLRRNDNGRLLERPSVKTKKTLGDRAFQVAAPFLWNKLPRSAREATNLESFKTLRHFYLRNHFSYLSISISLFVIIFYSFNVNIFYDFDRKICKILVINYCCDALLNTL